MILFTRKSLKSQIIYWVGFTTSKSEENLFKNLMKWSHSNHGNHGKIIDG